LAASSAPGHHSHYLADDPIVADDVAADALGERRLADVVEIDAGVVHVLARILQGVAGRLVDAGHSEIDGS
jgi:hypothetical protein